MATDATIQMTTTTRREASSAAWFWWKETRQLAPLVVLLVIVALVIIVLNLITDMAFRSFKFQVPNEITMLVFPGLFATGAGPLLIGQERALGTLNWLSLLPISARRLARTKFCVALVGLIVMWVFAFTVVTVFDLASPTTSHWRIGRHTSYSGNPFSYPVWIAHSLFILLSGFYVAWRIKNQFYSLVTLIPLAFSPIIVTSLLSELSNGPKLTGELDWTNLVLTLIGIVVVAPLSYRAAMRTLSPAAAPAVTPLLGGLGHSPAKDLSDAIAPRFGTQAAPIVWQSIHSARGTLAILIGMLLVSLFVSMRLAAVDRYQGLDGLIGVLLLAAPLAVCWLGVSVFKHDGSSERIRFLADRGVSPAKTYFALQAVPIAILSAALVVYGFWNLMISHREYVSSFASGLPTLLIMWVFVVLLYGVSQWVSQFVRTLILSVILAPILSFIVASWLVFAFSTCGFPVYGVVLCGIAPFAATFVMMRRYMDTRDRPSTFLVGGLVVAFIVLLPIGHAASSIRSVQGMKPKLRSELLAEARQFRGRMPRAVTVSMYGYTGERIDRNALDDDKLKEFVDSLGRYSMDPAQLVKPLTSDRSDESVAANIDLWSYRKWHGSFLRSRIQWRQDRDEQAWSEFTPWLSASAKLLSALRRSTILSDQEVADRLEVLLVDTIKNAVPQDRKEDAAVQAAIAALGTPASRAAARRKAVLVTWHFSLTDSRRNGLRYFVKMDHQPPGLLTWLEPRLIESFILAMLEGIDAAESQSADRGWRLKLHDIHQTGGVFETSRYGDMFRSMPAMETMSVGQQTGFGQLWGRDWEYIEPATIVETP